MSRTPRSLIFDAQRVGVYHCINRCVRRAFLCGEDSLTGNSFDHRRDWIRDRLKELAGILAIDVLGYAVLSNHFHVVLRNRPDVARQWSEREVARRWWNLFPKRRDERGRAARPTEEELKAVASSRKRVKELRRRLSDISWFMRCTAENIARRANAEDDTGGRFWSGRFRSMRILDETALLAVMIYVDLNPIRARISRTPETSRHTSAYDRIRARQQQPSTTRSRQTRSDEATPDGWLSPLTLDHESSPSSMPQGCRCSDLGCLPLTLDVYLELLDWTGRQLRLDKRGTIPQHLAPILERLQIGQKTWVEGVKDFGRRFRTAAGHAESLAAEAARRARRWLHGITYSRAVFSGD
jgi:hypothetical protein